MINYICDICGKNIGDNKRCCKTPAKYEIHMRRYSKSRHDKKPYAYSTYVDICDDCQAKVDAALDPIFSDIVDGVDFEPSYENTIVPAADLVGINGVDPEREE